MEKSVQPLTTKIITVSEYNRKLALMKKIAPAHKMLTIHSGIDQIEKTYKREWGASINRDGCSFWSAKKTGFIARGFSGAFRRTLALVIDRYGSLRPRLEEFIADKGLINRVSFWGNQLDVTSYLRKVMYLSCYQIGSLTDFNYWSNASRTSNYRYECGRCQWVNFWVWEWIFN